MRFLPSPFITPDELSARWKGAICTRTLANWRWKGTGPNFIKPGGKVLYRIDHVEAWEAQNMAAEVRVAAQGGTVIRLAGRPLYDAGIAEEWAIYQGGIIANDNNPDRGTY